MLKSPELAFLQADLAAVEDLLSTRNETDDPIGWFQFSIRKHELEKAIQTLQGQVCDHLALALCFGGKPLADSRGIDATFAARAIDTFQAIVAELLAVSIACDAKQGPASRKRDAVLLLTEVVRGSFVFLLEDASRIGQETLQDVALRAAVVDAVTLIRGLAQSGHEDAAEFLDDRIRLSLHALFVLLDESAATLRIVEGGRDFTLDRKGIGIARKKTEIRVLDALRCCPG